MGDAFRKVLPGQELSVPAEAYNGFIDAARAVRDNRHRIEQLVERDIRQATIVKVRNQSGQDLGRFSVLGIAGPLVYPTDDLLQFQQRVAFVGRVPISVDVNQFVLLFDPLADGAIGRAVVSGVSIAKVSVTAKNRHNRCASAVVDDTTALTLVCNGCAQVLWRQPGLGTKWAIVRLGAYCSCTGGSSSSDPSISEPSRSSSSSSSESTPPSESSSTPPSESFSTPSQSSSMPPSESTPSHSESTSLSQSESTSPPSSESSSEGSEGDSGSVGSDESFSGSLSTSEKELPF